MPEMSQSNGDEGVSPFPSQPKVGTDSIPFHRDVPDRTRSPKAVDPKQKKNDEYIMDTNNSSIVSKRSVEKLYYGGEAEYFRYFVSKFKRRSPLINRGYWLRMKSIEHSVTRFLAEQTPKRKIVVNLGCGYDPMPFSFLGKQPELCDNTTFVDVDYPVLMQNKCGIISNTEQLHGLLENFYRTSNEDGVLGAGNPYLAVGCDLRDLDLLKETLQDAVEIEDESVAILFVAEVSIAYMDRDASQAVLEWAATYPDVRFCLLEQHLPDGIEHPFARTMLAHFQKLRTPLHTIGTMDEMRQRFVNADWPENALEMHSLWELWSEPTFISPEQRRILDAIEPFDEWEEFALFASHYFLLLVERKADQDYTYRPHRMSLAANRASHVPSPVGSAGSRDDSDPEYRLYVQEFKGSQVPRRFGALIPPALRGQDGDAIGLHAGLGTQERLDDCDTYSWFDTAQVIDGPPLRQGIMCHTITRLGGTNNCMMVGGRTSPDRAIADCWLRQDSQWQKVESLPEARYRHCAVPVRLPTEPRPAHTLLVYGGRTGDGHVLDEWLLWAGEQGWTNLRVVGDHPCARFGAAMITDHKESISGVIVGGMTSAGRVLNDFWHWNLQPDMSITCQNVSARAISVLKQNATILGRFGAQLVRTEHGILLVGGVAGGRMLTRNDEILNMRSLRPFTVKNARPLFVGASVQEVDGGLLLLGGGATCFSFGTYWSKSCFLSTSSRPQEDMAWQLISSKQPEVRKTIMASPSMSTLNLPQGADNRASVFSYHSAHSTVSPSSAGANPDRISILPPVPSPSTARASAYSTASPSIRLDTPATPVVNGHGSGLPTTLNVPKVRLSGNNNFMKYLDAGQPVIISGLSFGSCTQYWSNEYLKEAIGADRKVSVHVSQNERMDFANKNFTYETRDFGSFLDAANSGEKLYLRSLSQSSPADTPANLTDDFPEIAHDFSLPEELAYVVANAHSTPLRISGPVTMWLHYDVMANVLCQVRGTKKLILFPPSDVAHLGFEAGASSSSLDVFSPTASAETPALRKTHPREALLEPGDILFIPSTWPHTAAPTSGMSVSVNCFFRSLEAQKYAAGRDVYGNRDLAAYERGRKDVAKIVKGFEGVPPHVGGFYLQRLGMELLEQAKKQREAAGEGLHEVYAELGS
ncbi:tRNA methyltransferase ppm2 [Saxophila tyrrhenica]|uniref:tRNA wybutosine-synthesizing protein 4 n=1 Tax=Saxophila tyrrhenica TaxID=1690608 RepID=A0AAV9NYK3_9PEZI|nr:tRNA methyltransferase ppm2 [Saxophila tyrrhenica]